MALPLLPTTRTPRSPWRHWMWFGALDRHWLLNRPLLWRSGLLWLPGPVLMMMLAAVALGWFDPIEVLQLPVAPVPTALGFLFFLLALAVYFYWVLVPRSRHALGVRGWRDHLRVLAITYLGTLLLVLPLCVYDGIFSQRVAALSPQAAVRSAADRLQALNDLPCSDQFNTEQSAQMAQLQRDLALLLGPVLIRQHGAQVCVFYKTQEKSTLNIELSSGSEWSGDVLRVGLDRVLHEHSVGAGPAPHALNAMAASFQLRQRGCIFFALLVLLLDLWWQFFSSRGRTVAVAAHWQALTARLFFWRRGKRLLRPLLLHQPALWAARPWPYIVGCFLISAASLLLLAPVESSNDSGSVVALLLMLSLPLTCAGIWYWKRVALARPLSAAAAADWRRFAAAVALGVAVALLAALVLPLHVLPENSLWRERGAAAVMAGFTLMAAQVVAAALLSQAAPGRGGLVALAGCYAVGTFAVFLLPPFGAVLLLPAFVLTGLASAWAARLPGGLYGRRWAVLAAQVQIALAPLAALSLVVALHASRQLDDTSLLVTFSAGDNFLFVAILVLALGWLITPAVNGLLRLRAEPV